MVNKFTAFRGMYNGDSWGQSFTEGFNDPTKKRRNAAATSLAEGEAAFQPMGQALQIGKFGQAGQALGLQGQRLGLDKEKFTEQKSQFGKSLADKQASRAHDSKLVRDRSLGSFSPYALAAADQGQDPMTALQLGSKMRTKQAGAESGARAGASKAVERKYAISGGALKRASEMIAEARAAGQDLPPQEAIKLAQEQMGETIYTGKSKALTPRSEKFEEARLKTANEMYKNLGKDEFGDPAAFQQKLTDMFGPEFAGEFLGKMQGRTAVPGAAGAVDPEEEAEAEMLRGVYEEGVAQYGEDPNQWPPEYLAKPAVRDALSRLQQ
jgi:hypothetical protein